MKIYGRPENCSSFVANNAPKKFGKVHLLFKGRSKDLRFLKIQTAVLKLPLPLLKLQVI